MATQCATATVLFGAGDIIAQQAIEKRGIRGHDVRDASSVVEYINPYYFAYDVSHDVRWPKQYARTARLSFYGGALFGPIMTKWYQGLNRLRFATPMRAVVYRVSVVSFPSYLCVPLLDTELSYPRCE